MLNESLNKVLKSAIREPRPVFRLNAYNEFGMPSNHSQFMSFFSTYALLFVLVRMPQINALFTFHVGMERLWRLLIVATTWLGTLLVCYGRVYLQYHTVGQVLVGFIVGLVAGIVWFAITQLILSPLYPKIVSWKISELLLLRDTTLIPNLFWFEYTTTRTEAGLRSRKLNSMKSQ